MRIKIWQKFFRPCVTMPNREITKSKTRCFYNSWKYDFLAKIFNFRICAIYWEISYKKNFTNISGKKILVNFCSKLNLIFFYILIINFSHDFCENFLIIDFLVKCKKVVFVFFKVWSSKYLYLLTPLKKLLKSLK